MNILNKISKVIERIVDVILIVSLMLMTAVFFSSVVARYVFNAGIFWAEELTRYLNVVLVMLGVGTLARYGANINISVLEELIKGKARLLKTVKILQQIFTIIFFVYASYVGFGFAATAKHISSNMKLPMSIMYNIMSIAFVLLSFQAFVYALNIYKKKEA